VHYDSDSFHDLLVAEYAKAQDVRDIHGNPSGVAYAYAWDECVVVSQASAFNIFIRLLDEGFDLIVQDHDHMKLTHAQARSYHVTLLYVAVSIETAKRRAAARALKSGRFLKPATADNNWGWDAAVTDMYWRYRGTAPWFALWADNFITVGNDTDGVLPSKREDFQVWDTHPVIDPKAHNWTSVVAGFMAAIAAAHGESVKHGGAIVASALARRPPPRR
jgi:hypothetical protein